MDLREGTKAWARGVQGAACEERASPQARTTGAARPQRHEAPAAGQAPRCGGRLRVSGSQKDHSKHLRESSRGQVTQGQDFGTPRFSPLEPLSS